MSNSLLYINIISRIASKCKNNIVTLLPYNIIIYKCRFALSIVFLWVHRKYFFGNMNIQHGHNNLYCTGTDV